MLRYEIPAKPANLEELKLHQLNENIMAYQEDLEYCMAQLDDPDSFRQGPRLLRDRQ
jgi:hypothetical protein